MSIDGSAATAPQQKGPEHNGMMGSGIVTATIAGLCLFYITIDSTKNGALIPAGWTAIFAVGCTVGTSLIFTSIILRHLELHRADHQTAALTVEDVNTIRAKLGLIARHVADMASVVSQICMHLPPDQQGIVRRDAAYLAEMAEMLRVGREIERQRPSTD